MLPIGIRPATLKKRPTQGRFKLAESDRIYRFAITFKAAADLFEGDHMAARDWMLKPAKGLGGKEPIKMLATSAETDAVLS